MFKIIHAIHEKTGKNSILLFFDIIYCGIVFQAGYYDYQEFEFYHLNNQQRKTYLTRGKNSKIIHTFNQEKYIHFFENKVEFNEKFANYIHHNWLYLQNDSENDFLAFFQKHHHIIAKPLDLSGGKQVEKFDYIDEAQAKEVYQNLIQHKQFLVEEYIFQHHEMNRLYDKSVNTLRIFTFIKDGIPYFLQAILRIGNGNIVDNFSSGGMYTYLDEQGVAFVEAIDQADNIFYNHPISSTQIVGFQVPMFQEAIELVKKCATVIPEVAYVGWDVAITENGPELIEGNCYPGVFQVKSSLSNIKEGLLPKYNKILNTKL